jgi:deazaflavin-dependent oxidoreductase (nitroreductase family)
MTRPIVCLLRVLTAVGVAVAATVAALYLLLLAYSPLLRLKWFSDRTRRFTKTANRPMRKIAGTRAGMLYFNLGALHHVGRRSGQSYVTPLSAYRLGDGFVLGVAYPEVDWCRNVLAAGECTLTWNGKEYALERPELISAGEAMKAYPLLVKPFIVVPGTKTFLWLHPAESIRSVEAK